MLEWFRQGSMRRFKSREASRTPLTQHLAGGIADDGRKSNKEVKENPTLAAMFMTLPEPLSTEDHHRKRFPQFGLVHRSRSAQVLDTESEPKLRKANTGEIVQGEWGQLNDASGLEKEAKDSTRIKQLFISSGTRNDVQYIPSALSL